MTAPPTPVQQVLIYEKDRLDQTAGDPGGG